MRVSVIVNECPPFQIGELVKFYFSHLPEFLSSVPANNNYLIESQIYDYHFHRAELMLTNQVLHDSDDEAVSVETNANKINSLDEQQTTNTSDVAENGRSRIE